MNHLTQVLEVARLAIDKFEDNLVLLDGEWCFVDRIWDTGQGVSILTQKVGGEYRKTRKVTDFSIPLEVRNKALKWVKFNRRKTP